MVTYLLWGFAVLGVLAVLGIISMVLAPEEYYEDED